MMGQEQRMQNAERTAMTEPTALGAQIEQHWREHRPQMVKELEKAGRLEQAVLEAQELTGDLLYELVSVKKMDYQAAWELASREWAFLPEDPPSPKRGSGATRSRGQGSGTRSWKGKRSPPKGKGSRKTAKPGRSRKRRRKTSG
jgi:hypothetical protein